MIYWSEKIRRKCLSKYARPSGLLVGLLKCQIVPVHSFCDENFTQDNSIWQFFPVDKLYPKLFLTLQAKCISFVYGSYCCSLFFSLWVNKKKMSKYWVWYHFWVARKTTKVQTKWNFCETTWSRDLYVSYHLRHFKVWTKELKLWTGRIITPILPLLIERHR